MSDNDYNGGKDVMPTDIEYSQVSDTVWQAMLCLQHPPSMIQFPLKCYAAFGPTKEEARSELVKIMCQHLHKLI